MMCQASLWNWRGGKPGRPARDPSPQKKPDSFVNASLRAQASTPSVWLGKQI